MPCAAARWWWGPRAWTPSWSRRLGHLAGETAVLSAPNFGVGVNLLLGLVERAARALSWRRLRRGDHRGASRRKEDAPSGTALALGRAVAVGRGEELERVRRDGRSGRTGARSAGEIGFHACAAGMWWVSTPCISWAPVSASPSATWRRSRDLFAEGALVAARWLADRGPGRYTMAQVLGLDA
jgi:4-hydroxy-tetrahydrodipicolinate reductase